MQRVEADQAYLKMAMTMATRSTCLDKQVGCLLVSKDNIVIATGYNGAPRGFPHCSDKGRCIVDLTGNKDRCPAAHAEQNAMLQCRTPELIHTCYTTLSPCVNCVRLLLNTPCKRIVFFAEHQHKEPESMWKGEWISYGV